MEWSLDTFVGRATDAKSKRDCFTDYDAFNSNSECTLQ